MPSRRKLRKSGLNLRATTKDLTAALAILVPTGMAYAQTAAPAAPPVTQGTPAAADAAPPSDASVLSDLVVNASAIPSIASEAVGGAGFAKPLLETPRAVSLINEETLNLLGINAIEDIVRAVPGTYTTTRYGLQGGINVRGIPADVYWRGMKRITAQGHYRTDLSSLSSMEIVKGAAPPIFGLGRIGGYVNQTPRSGGKAQNGTYLSDLSGFVQGVTGSFEKLEATTGVGGPVDIAGKQGGFYTYGLVENSGTYVRQVNVRQRLLQSALSLNNVGMFRVESGFQIQNSQTSGGYMNRVTQGLINNGTYVRGSPLVNLDAGAGPNDDGISDGFIGQREQHANSPVNGVVTSANRPLDQRFNWPKCTGENAQFAGPGGYCLPGHFPVQPGIPDNLFTYLEQHPEKDKDHTIRNAYALGKGVVPASGQLPQGFFLDPTTTGYSEVDYRRNGAYERLQNANVGLAWFDLVYDTDPNFTMKIQTFTDNLDTFKDSSLPYGEKQGLHRFEEKFTVTRQLPEQWLPGWIGINTLSSINYRRTAGYIRSSSGDFDYRQDVLRGDPQYGDGNYYSNTKFASQLNNPSILTGAPAESERRSVYDEFGAGFMFDVTLLKNTSLTLGGRWDGSTARDIEYEHYNQQRPTASNSCVLPGKVLDAEGNEVRLTSELIENSQTQLVQLTSGRCDYGPAWDDGKTWSISLSHQLPYGVRPYFTIADASVVLDASNNVVANTIVTAPGGHIGRSKLTEAGIKGNWFGGKLFASVAMYRQLRSDVSTASDPTAGADSSATKTRGLEMQIDANPTRKFHIGVYAVGQHQKYVFNSNSTLQLDGRMLGFQDILNPDGSVLYPAEAFVYGGRMQLVLPTELGELYLDRVGEPRYQVGVNMDYKLGHGFAVHVDGQRFSAHYLDRTKLVELPQSFTLNTGFTYDRNRLHLKLSGFNVLDERYFRAGTGDSNVNLVSVMPGAAVQFQAKLDY